MAVVREHLIAFTCVYIDLYYVLYCTVCGEIYLSSIVFYTIFIALQSTPIGCPESELCHISYGVSFVSVGAINEV